MRVDSMIMLTMIFGMISMNMMINVMSSVCVKLKRRQSKKVWEIEH